MPPGMWTGPSSPPLRPEPWPRRPVPATDPLSEWHSVKVKKHQWAKKLVKEKKLNKRERERERRGTDGDFVSLCNYLPPELKTFRRALFLSLSNCNYTNRQTSRKCTNEIKMYKQHDISTAFTLIPQDRFTKPGCIHTV